MNRYIYTHEWVGLGKKCTTMHRAYKEYITKKGREA